MGAWLPSSCGVAVPGILPHEGKAGKPRCGCPPGLFCRPPMMLLGHRLRAIDHGSGNGPSTATSGLRYPVHGPSFSSLPRGGAGPRAPARCIPAGASCQVKSSTNPNWPPRGAREPDWHAVALTGGDEALAVR